MINLKEKAQYYIDQLKTFQLENDIHCKNLIKKLNNTIADNDARFEDINTMDIFIKSYIEYRTGIEEIIVGIKKEDLFEKVESLTGLLNNYKETSNYINRVMGETFGRKEYFTSQSKYESTIIEEFISFIVYPLFKNISYVKFGQVNPITSTSFHVAINEKNEAVYKQETNRKAQDYSVYIEINDENGLTIQIPIICFECKTYIDKTMLSGILTTARDIKNGVKNCKFFIVTELLDISDLESINDVIDNIFILRRNTRSKQEKTKNRIYADIILRLIECVDESIQDLKVKNNHTNKSLIDKGYLK